MSSSMRWRSGLMGFSLIGAPVSRLGCFNPSILKTEPPPVTSAQSTRLLSSWLTASSRPLSPAVAGSFAGRVGVWRGDGRTNISVAAPFVWRCLTGSSMAPFPHPAHRTGHADLPHPALGQDVTPSPTTGPTKPCEAYELEVPVKVREWIAPALASPDFVLVPEPPAQPHSRVVVERAIRFAGGADTEVIGPSAKRAVQHVDELCGLLPATRSVGQRMDSFDHALDALL